MKKALACSLKVSDKGGRVGIWEDGLLVPTVKACTMLTRYLITGLPLRSEPAQEKWFQVEQSAHISPFGFVGWLYLKHLLGVMTSSFW